MSSDIVTMLLSATQKDLDSIDEQIEAKQLVIAGIQQDIESLKSIRRAVDVKINGKAERKKAERTKPAQFDGRSAGVGGQSTRERIYDYLAVKNRAVKPTIIASDLAIGVPTVYAAVKHEWFNKTKFGIEIAKSGGRFGLEDQE